MVCVMLAFFWDIDDQIAKNARIASEAPTFLEPILSLVVTFGFGKFGQVLEARGYTVFGELSLLGRHLAFSTLSLTTTNGF